MVDTPLNLGEFRLPTTTAAVYAALAPVIPGLAGTTPHEMVLALASDGHQVEATWSYSPLSDHNGTRHWGSAGTLAVECAVWAALRSVMTLPPMVQMLTVIIPAEGPVTWQASSTAWQPVAD
jgi:hypothetical protein